MKFKKHKKVREFKKVFCFMKKWEEYSVNNEI